jgi:transposase
MSELLKSIGKDRKPITDYMHQLAEGDSFFLIDATSIVSYSKNLSQVANGITKNKTFEPVFNLLYFYAPDTFLPAYYRIFNGNIKDVKMVSLAIKESRYKKAIIIGDKGFYSENNLEILEEAGLKYIVPLKRNSSLIRLKLFKNLTQSNKHFLFDERVIYYTSYSLTPQRTIYLFTDEQMMVKEKKDFIFRMNKHPDQYTEDMFKEQLPLFGTISLIANGTEQPETVFLNYKSRANIEILFDGAKNILGNDYTYMQNDYALEGWMFINHLALQVHHTIYSILKTKKLLHKYSIRDFIEYIAGIKKVRINEHWYFEPVVTEQQKFLKELGIHIT